MSENVTNARKTLFIGVSSIAVLAILGSAVVLFVLPALGIGGARGLVEPGFVRLSAENPAVLHPDGILVSFQAGGEPVTVRLSSQPREQFIAGEAGPAWADALANIPSDFRLLSPIYTIETRDVPTGRLFAEMNIPNGAEPLETLSLYAWDPETVQWTFVPSQQDILRDVIGFTPTQALTHVAAIQKETRSPEIGLVLQPATTVDAALAQQIGIILPTGVTLLADGSLSGAPVANNAFSEASSRPLISNVDFDSGTGFLTFADPALNEAAFNTLTGLAADHAGIMLDFSVSTDQRDGFSAFVQQLQSRLGSQGKSLSITMRGTTLTAYNLPLLGQTVDQIWWVPGDDPSLYLDGGTVQNVLYTLVGNIDRHKLGLLVSADSIDISSSSTTPLTTEQAMSRFGQIAAIEGYLSEEGTVMPGEEIPLRLTGSLQTLSYDANLGANYLAYTSDDDQLHHVYLSSAEGLARKLRWANVYGLHAASVRSVADPLAIDSVTNGLLAFANQAPAPAPAALNIIWQVLGSEDEVISETSGDLTAIQFLWQAEAEPGDYTISAEVRGQTSSSLGTFDIAVVEPPAPAPVVQTVVSTDDGTTTQPATAPVVTAGGAAVGGFELGGQARDTGSANYMHSAGMNWIKYQIRSVGDIGGVAGAVAQGHAAGFKVLVTIIDPGWNHADYGFFTSFMSDVAAQGPDAIEVWNEMNLSREWPADQIGGANYVNNMLAPAFNAIKSVNPAIIVISGAPSPTGAFGGCPAPSPIPGEAGCNDDEFLRQMAAAGGANFMDCVGVHFNAGATSPYQNSGHPGGGHYSWYLQPMINLYSGTLGKPLCFTELGYVIGGNLAGGPFGWANTTTTEQHAQWLAEAATLNAQSGRVRLMIVWNVAGYSGDPTYDPQGEYSIVRPGGDCPACTTLGQAMGVQ